MKYRFYGFDVAMQMLRPDATFEAYNGKITRWNDPRPCPTQAEIYETMEKIKAFEQSIPTIWLTEPQEA